MGDEIRQIAAAQGWTESTTLSVLITVLERQLHPDQQDLIVEKVEDIANDA